jgi:hypothetical protein
MKSRLLTLFILLTLAGCATNQREALATFSVNDTAHNYGDGEPDGCLIEHAFSLKLRTVSADSVSGVIYKAGTATPLPYATVLALPQHTAEAITLVANSAGHFAISRSWNVQRIDVSMPGYRTLTVNLASKKLP